MAMLIYFMKKRLRHHLNLLPNRILFDFAKIQIMSSLPIFRSIFWTKVYSRTRMRGLRCMELVVLGKIYL